RLVRALEPLSAWVRALGGVSDPGTIEFAWRVALENHPHDSICGCSVDAVHRQMETRFERVAEIAGEALERVGRQWVARVAPVPAGGAAAGDPFVVWNPNAGGAALVDAELELDVRGAKTAHVRDSSGRRIPAELELVGEGTSWGGSFPRALAESILPAIGGGVLGHHVHAGGAPREGGRRAV